MITARCCQYTSVLTKVRRPTYSLVDFAIVLPCDCVIHFFANSCWDSQTSTYAARPNLQLSINFC